MLHLLLLLALCPLQGTSLPGARQRAPQPFQGGGPPAGPPNIILILADDFGVNMVSAYGEAPDPPCTPTLDRLASEGILFRNAWTNPICKPTRAQTLTGRYGFRTGLGEVAAGDLMLDETTLPEMLSGYATAAIGKWHLADASDTTHPNDQGFDYYAGALRGAIPDYFDWPKTTNGSNANTTTYATTDAADEAILAAQTLPEPFFLYVAFNAPHNPTHQPPTDLCPEGPCASFCDSNPNTTPERVKAMSEAMDTEIGRMLETIEAMYPNTLIVFMGDNGTAGGATEAPFDPQRSKGSIYEGGVNVPLIVKGPGVKPGECAGLVASADFAATFTELAGLTTTAEDSVSMVPYFSDPSLSLRSTVYSERFSPNHGTPPYDVHDRAVRNFRYKLIRRIGEPDEFYDLATDAFEDDDLFPTLVPGTEANDNYLALEQALVDLGVD